MIYFNSGCILKVCVIVYLYSVKVSIYIIEMERYGFKIYYFVIISVDGVGVCGEWGISGISVNIRIVEDGDVFGVGWFICNLGGGVKIVCCFCYCINCIVFKLKMIEVIL